MLRNEQIRQISEQSGLGLHDSTPVGTGHYNDSFFIDSSIGKLVLRIAPSDDIPKLFYEKDMMKSEVNIHRKVREQTNVPVPKIIHYDFSRRIIQRDYLIMTFLEGSSGTFDEAELGRYVRELHHIKGDQYGYPDRTAPTGKNWPDIFLRYAELIFDDCLHCGAIDKKEHDFFLTVYRKYRNVFHDCQPCLLHLDLWWQNILTLNGKISAILDFDRGLYGDPELEFAVLDTYGYSTPRFFHGYGNSRPAGKEAEIRRKLYIVYELIKYAFIRTARGKNRHVGRSHVRQCTEIINSINNE